METRRNVKATASKPWMKVILLAAPMLALTGAFVPACTDANSNGFRGGLAGDSCSRTADCNEPLRCTDNICTEPPSTVTPDAGNPDAFGPGPGPSADAGPWGQCDECLEEQCASTETLCKSDCIGIEACIETTCAHLSETGSSDEGQCFVQCQNRFPNGKAQHLALVNCAQSKTANCQPPCTFYPQDYELCRMFMNNGDCFGYLAACDADPNCKNYRDCVSICGTLTECLACDDSPEGTKGRELLEGYQACVASECITESWMP